MPRLTPIKRRRFEKFLRYIGCRFERQKGSHLIYGRSDLKRPIVFPADREISKLVLRSNLKTLKLKPREFLEILKEVK